MYFIQCTGGRGSKKSKVRLKAWVIIQEQGPTAKKRKTVVKKIPALSKNVSSNALKTKKDSEQARDDTSLEQRY